jgi:putative endopeptidase
MRHFFLIGAISIIIMSNGCTKPNEKTKVIDPENMDLNLSPSQDFYHYANGGWMKNNPLRPEFSRYGAFDKLAEDNLERLRTLAEKLATDTSTSDPIALKTGLFYKVGMDSIRAQQLGTKPIEGDLSRIESIKNQLDLQKMIAYLHSRGINPLFNLMAEADSKNSNMVIGWLFQGGLGMPDRDYYVESNEHTKELQKAYIDYVSRLFVLTGSNPAVASNQSKVVFSIETRLAKASMTRLEMRDPNAIYHKISRTDLHKVCPAFDWDLYFATLNKTETGDLNLAQPEFFKSINAILSDVPIQDWKTYLQWNVINEAAPYLTYEFEKANFEFYGKALSGKQEMQARWKKVVNSTNEALGMALGQMYVKEYFPPEAKSKMLNLVGNLKVALNERISKLEWMSDTTKGKAVEKLEAMKLKIGYPDKWRDYSALAITNSSFAENMQVASAFNVAYMLSKINCPVDPTEWGMTPQTVNAYYDPSKNEIVFPAGILQPPFFFQDADDAVNYGAIGMVIGHEMTHGFDDQGRQFDKDGNLVDWWTSDDARKFNERTENLVNQYSSYSVQDSLKANGKLTLGENIADLGGMYVAISAFLKTPQGQTDEKIDGFSPTQRFFLAYAHVWAQNIRDQEVIRRTKEDEHSLGILRVTIPLMNMPQFGAAFDVKEGDAMFLPEQKRACIW